MGRKPKRTSCLEEVAPIKDKRDIFLDQLKTLPDRLKENANLKHGYLEKKLKDIGILYTCEIVEEFLNLQQEDCSKLPAFIRELLNIQRERIILNDFEKYRKIIQELIDAECFTKTKQIKRKDGFNILHHRILCELLLKLKPSQYKMGPILYMDQNLTQFQRNMQELDQVQYQNILQKQKLKFAIENSSSINVGLREVLSSVLATVKNPDKSSIKQAKPGKQSKSFRLILQMRQNDEDDSFFNETKNRQLKQEKKGVAQPGYSYNYNAQAQENMSIEQENKKDAIGPFIIWKDDGEKEFLNGDEDEFLFNSQSKEQNRTKSRRFAKKGIRKQLKVQNLKFNKKIVQKRKIPSLTCYQQKAIDDIQENFSDSDMEDSDNLSSSSSDIDQMQFIRRERQKVFSYMSKEKKDEGETMTISVHKKTLKKGKGA